MSTLVQHIDSGEDHVFACGFRVLPLYYVLMIWRARLDLNQRLGMRIVIT